MLRPENAADSELSPFARWLLDHRLNINVRQVFEAEVEGGSEEATAGGRLNVFSTLKIILQRSHQSKPARLLSSAACRFACSFFLGVRLVALKDFKQLLLLHHVGFSRRVPILRTLLHLVAREGVAHTIRVCLNRIVVEVHKRREYKWSIRLNAYGEPAAPNNFSHGLSLLLSVRWACKHSLFRLAT